MQRMLLLVLAGLACCAATRAAPESLRLRGPSESALDGYCQQCQRDCLAGIDGTEHDIALLPGEMNDDTIREAVRLWFSNRTAAEAAYGPIATWDTSGVTDMAFLFCVRADWMDEATVMPPESTYDLRIDFAPTLSYFREFCVLSSSSWDQRAAAPVLPHPPARPEQFEAHGLDTLELQARERERCRR